MAFTNPFLSIAGQAERLKNAGAAVLGAVQNVASTVTLGAVPKVEFEGNKFAVAIAEKPAQAALVLATLATPKTAVTVAKQAASGVAKVASSTFSSLSGLQKAAVVAAAPVVAGTLISSEKARSGVINAPTGLVNVGTNIGKLIENPSVSNAATIFKENPILGTAAAVIPALVVGGAVTKTAVTVANTLAVSKQTKALESISAAAPTAAALPTVTASPAGAAPAPASNVPQVVAPVGGESSVQSQPPMGVDNINNPTGTTPKKRRRRRAVSPLPSCLQAKKYAAEGNIYIGVAT